MQPLLAEEALKDLTYAQSSLADDLLKDLIDAKLAGTKIADGSYRFRSNEEAAKVALKVFWERAKEWYANGHLDEHEKYSTLA